MGRQMVEQERAKGHLRVVRFTAKVILGPLLALVLWTLVYNFTPAPQSGTVSDFQLRLGDGALVPCSCLPAFPSQSGPPIRFAAPEGEDGWLMYLGYVQV